MQHGLKRSSWHAVGGLALVLTAGVPAPSGQAASLQPQDVQILAKALGFLDPPVLPSALLAIVYTPGDAASYGDAEALAQQIGAGLQTQQGMLHPVLIASTALATRSFGLLIAASGAASEAVIAAARAQRVLCVTGDLAAVHAGTCTMAIRSGRKVEIFINRDVATRSGLRFATAFRMMVHEL